MQNLRSLWVLIVIGVTPFALPALPGSATLASGVQVEVRMARTMQVSAGMPPAPHDINFYVVLEVQFTNNHNTAQTVVLSESELIGQTRGRIHNGLPLLHWTSDSASSTPLWNTANDPLTVPANGHVAIAMLYPLRQGINIHYAVWRLGNAQIQLHIH